MGQIIPIGKGNREQEPQRPTITRSNTDSCPAAGMEPGSTGTTGITAIGRKGIVSADWTITMPSCRRSPNPASCLLHALQRGAVNGLQITEPQTCNNCGANFTPVTEE